MQWGWGGKGFGGGACPSCQYVRGGVHGHLASASQGHTDTNDIYIYISYPLRS